MKSAIVLLTVLSLLSATTGFSKDSESAELQKAKAEINELRQENYRLRVDLEHALNTRYLRPAPTKTPLRTSAAAPEKKFKKYTRTLFA